MLGFLKAIPMKIFGYAAMALAFMASLFFYGRSREEDGRQEKTNEDRERIYDATKRKKDIEIESRSGDDSIRDKLRKQRERYRS